MFDEIWGAVAKGAPPSSICSSPLEKQQKRYIFSACVCRLSEEPRNVG